VPPPLDLPQCGLAPAALDLPDYTMYLTESIIYKQAVCMAAAAANVKAYKL